ncbi:hypothetical protein Syun_028431 [Stephania yunnanensis]|uniref:Uncharacterized protein n=1 Tax=Stephania yunnanensis TaxID=152371 RepID=A0AAP0EHC3_9MAGN
MSFLDAGLMSIASCAELSVLRLAICYNLRGNGLIQVGKFCQKLIELNLYRLSRIWVDGVDVAQKSEREFRGFDGDYYVLKGFGLWNKCLAPERDIYMYRLMNLSYCSITDVGLLALAKITCLRSITILHLRGLSTRGLLVALLACGGLRMVKLHELFKSLFPQSFLEHMESRGCFFNWRNKSFQNDLDPWSWRDVVRKNADLMYALDECLLVTLLENHHSLNMKRTPMKFIQFSSMPIDENITLKKILKFIQISSMPIDENITVKKKLKSNVKLPRARSQLDKSIEFEHERLISG